MNKMSKVGGPSQLRSAEETVYLRAAAGSSLGFRTWAERKGKEQEKSKTNKQQMESVPELEALPVCISPGLELLLGALFLPQP